MTADTDKMPEDADIVVDRSAARGGAGQVRRPPCATTCSGTNRKDKKKGKLIVLFDVVQRGGKGPMVRTGLEALVAEQGVRVGDNRVLDPSSRRDPLALTVIADPRSKNPIARAFSNEAEGSSLFLLLPGPDRGAGASEPARRAGAVRPTT